MVCLLSGIDKTVVCAGNRGRSLDVEISWPRFHASVEDVTEALQESRQQQGISVGDDQSQEIALKKTITTAKVGE